MDATAIIEYELWAIGFSDIHVKVLIVLECCLYFHEGEAMFQRSKRQHNLDSLFGRKRVKTACPYLFLEYMFLWGKTFALV